MKIISTFEVRRKNEKFSLNRILAVDTGDAHAVYEVKFEVLSLLSVLLRVVVFFFCHGFCGRHEIKYEDVCNGKHECWTSHPRGGFV